MQFSGEDGAGAVMSLLLLVVLIGLLALTVDGGLLWTKYRQARRANDAGALAAALECGTSGNESKANTSADAVASGNSADMKGVPGSAPGSANGYNAYDPSCSASKGSVTVHYWAGVELMFWPAVCALISGCSVSSTKDVAAQATAIWGFAGGGPVFPLTVSRNRLSTCGIPDSMMELDIGRTRCAFYFDQGSDSTWGLINLTTWGWPGTTTPSGCAQADQNLNGGGTQNQGNAQYVAWGQNPPMEQLTDDPVKNPTFVCPTGGNRPVLYDTNPHNPNSVIARAIASGLTYSFPVNQPGPCTSAPLTCNTIDPSGGLGMYAIIGFANLKPAEICGTSPNPNTPGFACTGSSATADDKTLCNALITPATPATSTSRCLVAEWEGYTTSNTDQIVDNSFGNLRAARLTA